jgi:predicted nucleic acid-binding protein
MSILGTLDFFLSYPQYSIILLNTLSFTVLYDANVLYPFYLRDLLIQLALDRAKWTDKINEEWSSHLILKNPHISQQTINNTIEKMNKAVPDSLVRNFESLINSINLPDLNDRHVLAAAIKGKAQVIVTYNKKDFPSDELNKYDIEAQLPDEFLSNLINLSPNKVFNSVQKVRNRLNNPPHTIENLIEVYRKQKLITLCNFLLLTGQKELMRG